MVEATFDFSDRLFSLDSDDSSFIQHADYFNGIKTQERDYYEDLFTPDIEEDSNEGSISDSSFQDDSNPNTIFIDNLIEQLQQFENSSIRESSKSCLSANDSLSTTKSDIRSHGSDSCHTKSFMDDSISIESAFIPWIPDENPTFKLNPAASILNDEEISQLVDGHTSIPPPITRETQSKINEDIIACFNVRNKYEHNAAAELFMQENLSFLSIQEPFCSRHKVSDSWKAFRMLELDSARIRCFETPYQVILFDTWKWGGKLLYPFQSRQYGRVTSIAFNFGKNQKLGIISVYAPSNVHAASQSNEPNNSLKITAELVEKIKIKWENEQKDIQIVILGDLQETITMSDRDNLGKYRQETSPYGLLHLTRDSHESIVRKISGKTEYITRFGTEGGRGIDHILTPINSPMSEWIINAKVDRQKGAEFFPSDHSLISCTFRRNSQNNNESSISKTKYNYKKVCSIKLKQSGSLGENLELDDSQFKDCQSFREQKKLYSQIRQLTNDSSKFTKNHLDDLQNRIKILYKNLWEKGLQQKADGKRNKLVDISDEDAIEVAYILQQFNRGVKEAMSTWELQTESSANDSAGKIRKRIRRKKGFKLFANLPTTTKLYYLKKKLIAKSKFIQKKLYWLNEHHIRNSNNASKLNVDDFWLGFQEFLNCKKMTDSANLIHGIIITETEERSNHIEAIQHKKFEAKLNKKTPHKRKLHKPPHVRKESSSPNCLNIEEKITKRINFWLTRSNCGQCFNTETCKDTFELLQDNKIESWNEPWQHVLTSKPNLEDNQELKKITEMLESTKKNLQKIYGAITNMQSQYKKDLLAYFLSSGKISDFTRKVMPKSRSAPSTHSLIWDNEKGDFRSCIDEAEEMIATSEFHGKWMGNTSAQEVCAYAKLVRKGKLGCRGVKLSPNRIVTKKDLNSLLPNHKTLPKKIKKAFLAAHNQHTAAIFKEPESDKKELFYPFFLTSENGEMMEDSNIIKNYWKGLARIPGKARFEGFQMSVLGRFGSRWGQVLLDITKLILITRYVPPELRKMARFPIPKPGKTNEYRPISLCNDLYCYVNAISTSYSSIGIEKAEILHDGMCAYRKGRGCSSLVTTELCFREDCNEHNLPVLQLDEDEEKFFDRVPVEILLAAMRTNGFPCQGFIELKASCMQEKMVEIITSKGIAYAKFVCGLEQGNPDSPTVSNLVIKMKHDIWQHMTSAVADKLIGTNSSTGKYEFQSVDPNDGPVTLCRIGYCDDNSKFCCVQNEEDLIYLANYFLQLSGDLSMVTKIGRKSSKCELQFYNVSARFAHKIQKCWSTAWSYVSDGPVEESVPIKLHMKANERQKFYQLIDYFNLDEIIQSKWDKIVHPEAHKHLGLKCTLGGDTIQSSKDTITKIHERLHSLNISSMNTESQRKSINMLCSTMHSFVPLQVGYSPSDLAALDHIISGLLLRRNGLTTSDCRHRLFLPENEGGLDFTSLLDQDIIQVARELEIVSNLPILEGEAFRTRIQAIPNYVASNTDDIINHARSSINKLAGYGLFFQDREDDIINNMLAKFNDSGKFASIGTKKFKDGNKYSMGVGKRKNHQITYGGPIHLLLRKWKDNNWILNEEIEKLIKSSHITKSFIIQTKENTIKERFFNVANIFSFWEWKNDITLSKRHISKDKKDWSYINIPTLLQQKFPDSYLKFDDATIKEEAAKLVELQCWNPHYNGNENCLFNKYNFFQNAMQKILQSENPLMISTDGAHELAVDNPYPSHNITSSAFVVSLLDIKPGESIGSREWEKRQSIPILSRASKLPDKIGNSNSDIATGEMFAFAMSELALPQSLPRIIITDSKSTRDILLRLRSCKTPIQTDRNYVRSIAGGVSKFIMDLFQQKFSKPNPNSECNVPEEIREKLTSAVDRICTIAKSWLQHNNQSSKEEAKEHLMWENEYWDQHISRTIWKANSHQLNDRGDAIKHPPRYPNLVPNLCILSCNHHADISADVMKDLFQITKNINVAYSACRFSILWNGMTLDRHVSPQIREIIKLERVKRLRSKPTQGFLWRILPYVTADWDLLQLHKSFFRSTLGFTRSHTRCLYKNEKYRNICWSSKQIQHNKELQHFDSPNSNQEMIKLLSPCMWCDLSQQTPITEKGNRKHAFLYCKHKNLSSFREDMNQLINKKLTSFFISIAEISSWKISSSIVEEIAQHFYQHQMDNTCRLSNKPTSRNNTYLPISELLRKWEHTSIPQAIMNDKCTILLEIFGITPRKMTEHKGDEEAGLIDAPWMGLVPIFMDRIMLQACNPTGSARFNDANIESITKFLIKDWEAIKSLILGRATGLHRVVSTSGKDIEKFFTKHIKDNQPASPVSLGCVSASTDTSSSAPSPSDAKLSPKTPRPCLLTPLPIRKRRSPNTAGSSSSSKKVKLSQVERILTSSNELKNANSESPSSEETKMCTGITCGRGAAFWCTKCNFEQSSIGQSKKQCQRCGRFMTALKQATITMANINQDIKSEPVISSILQFCRDNPSSLQFKYVNFMDLLDVYIPKKERAHQPRYTNKTIPDRLKLICKVIHKGILHHHKKLDTDNSIFNQSYQFISKAFTQFNNILESSKSAKTINSNAAPFLQLSSFINKYSETGKTNFKSQQAIDINSANTYLGGSAINKAVEVIRARGTANIFIAHADCYLTIRNWRPQQQWQEFARIFSSQRVIDEKPLGLYILPIFSGDNNQGHWHIIVIERRSNCCQGWHIDSLGVASDQRTIQDILHKAFLPGRGRFIWTEHRSRPQTECECGPRSILAMHTVVTAVANGKSSEIAVAEASFFQQAGDSYCSKSVRLEAALLVDEHTPTMHTRLRRRNRPSSTSENNLESRLKKRRIRRSKGRT